MFVIAKVILDPHGKMKEHKQLHFPHEITIRSLIVSPDTPESSMPRRHSFAALMFCGKRIEVISAQTNWISGSSQAGVEPAGISALLHCRGMDTSLVWGKRGARLSPESGKLDQQQESQAKKVTENGSHVKRRAAPEPVDWIALVELHFSSSVLLFFCTCAFSLRLKTSPKCAEKDELSQSSDAQVWFGSLISDCGLLNQLLDMGEIRDRQQRRL
ncbi:hypothetical protein SRHO_G00066010 [Serrasalmus rhombeus]